MQRPVVTGAGYSTAVPDTPLFPLSRDLRLACMRIARRVRAESRDEVPQHQWSILTRLETQPLGVIELAAREKVAQPVMTRHINDLERIGYVERVDDPRDGRRRVVRLTEAGIARMREIARNRNEWMAVQLSSLSDDEIDLLRRATRILQRFE